MRNHLLIACLFVLWSNFSIAQNSENVGDLSKAQKYANHNVKTATTLALVPGLGQIYNRKYWKAPFVWAAMGGAGYVYYDINSDFNTFKDVLQHITDNPGLDTRILLEADRPELYANLPQPVYQSTASGVAQEAIGYMEQYRSQREYAAFGILGVYLLNILDANIDAHLFHFDVSDDLSVRPGLLTSPNGGFAGAIPAVGVRITLP